MPYVRVEAVDLAAACEGVLDHTARAADPFQDGFGGEDSGTFDRDVVDVVDRQPHVGLEGHDQRLQAVAVHSSSSASSVASSAEVPASSCSGGVHSSGQ